MTIYYANIADLALTWLVAGGLAISVYRKFTMALTVDQAALGKQRAGIWLKYLDNSAASRFMELFSAALNAAAIWAVLR